MKDGKNKTILENDAEEDHQKTLMKFTFYFKTEILMQINTIE